MTNLPSTGAARYVDAFGQNTSGTISYACRIAPNTLLFCGYFPHALTGKEVIHIDGIEAQKPYLIALLSHGPTPLTVMILRVEERYLLEAANEISFTSASGAFFWYNKTPLDETGAAFSRLTEGLPPADTAKLYYLLLKYSGLQPSAASDPHFLRLCLNCLALLEPSAVDYRRAFWLLPDTLYLEGEFPPRPAEQIKAIFASATGLHPARVEMAPFMLGAKDGEGTATPMLIHFNLSKGVDLGDGMLCLLFKDRLVALKKPPLYQAPDIAGFITYLKRLAESERLGVRDFTTHQIIQYTPAQNRSQAAGLVRNLQFYLPPAHTTLYNKEQPFGLNVEVIHTIGQEGIFLCGWMHDPLHMLQELTLYSDLGYTLKIEDKLIFYRRDDVTELYADAVFPAGSNPQGFAAYIEFSEAHRKTYVAWPEGFTYRLTAFLQGGISYTVSPAPFQADPFTLRKKLLGPQMQGWIGRANAPLKALGAAARAIQELCVQQVDVQATYTFGVSLPKPKVSVVIPLYQNLEFLAAQMAHFAGDSAMEKAELIYVLDSPHQEEAVREKLNTLFLLYRFPVKLLVLSNNAGFAAATNLGAKEAKAEKLLLMNSDVVPAYFGWLDRLLEYHAGLENPGATAPRLLYEDGGMQHAGMYFSMNEVAGHYENLHYYKGYPASHEAARQSRAVPAVSAACLLIDRKAFEKAGRLSTDYVIGDFEDSDLCLKLSRLGYTHYYCAEVELYHFERQSFHAASASENLRYRINAREHHERWAPVMEDLMEQYHGK